jgi:predicted metal-dependent peptidase
LDDIYRRCVEAGMACPTRGLLPAGLLEEIKSLFTPPVPWDVELARWMEANVPIVREPLRTYARASRRQASTPDIPRPARYVPQEWKDACTFGVILDTSGSMDREVLGRALGAIASYAEARDVTGIRLVLCMLFLSAKVVALVSFFGYNTCYA